MASAIATDKLFARNKMTMYAHGGATATDIAWVDMRDYEYFAVGVVATALTGVGVTAFTILANPQSDGGGADVEIKAHAVGSAPDAVGDYLWLECSAEEIKALGATLRYVSANVDLDNAADDVGVVYILSGAKFPQDGLTADFVAP